MSQKSFKIAKTKLADFESDRHACWKHGVDPDKPVKRTDGENHVLFEGEELIEPERAVSRFEKSAAPAAPEAKEESGKAEKAAPVDEESKPQESEEAAKEAAEPAAEPAPADEPKDKPAKVSKRKPAAQ
jgi:hypothetical protein